MLVSVIARIQELARSDSRESCEELLSLLMMSLVSRLNSEILLPHHQHIKKCLIAFGEVE
jgi:hypothetical protein